MRRWLRVFLVTIASLSILALPSPHASAAITAFTLDSQPGDYIGDGEVLVFTSANSQIHAGVRGSGVQIDVNQDPAHTFGAIIEPPDGQSLAPGTYQTKRFGDATFAGLDVSGDGSGCNMSSGVLTIHEIVADESAVHVFAASYEQHCEEAVPALFGEIRFNSSVGFQAASNPTVSLRSTARVVDSATSVEVTSLGSDPLQFQTASIEGPDRADFKIGADSCSGISLAPQSTCRIEVEFTSAGGEPPSALLRIPEGTRRGSREVQLGAGGGVLPTVTKTKLLGNYGKRGKYELFHVKDGVLQVGFTLPPEAANRLLFVAEWKRGGKWRPLGSQEFRVKRGVAAAVFGGRIGTYRANNQFEGKAPFASSTSKWEYFKITP